jgi:nitroreductase
MEFTDAVRRRRMVRSFSGNPVPGPLLDQLLDNALRGPSAGNTGGWDAVVLQGPSETMVFWEATTTPDWRASSRRWPGLERAPVAVLLFAHPDAYTARYAEPDKESSGLGAVGPGAGGPGAGGPGAGGPGAGDWPVPYWFVETGFPVLLLLLGAVDAGLGACFLGNFRGERSLATALGIPDDRRYVGTVLLGEPGGLDAPSPSLTRGRRRADDVVHRGRW